MLVALAGAYALQNPDIFGWSLEPTCPDGYHYLDGKCKPDNDDPVPPIPPPQCQSGFIYSNGVCVPQQQPDNTAPTVTISSPQSGSTIAAGTTSVTISGTAADNVAVAKVEASVNNGAYTAVTGTTTWSGGINNLQNGQSYTIKVRATDTSSNPSSIKTVTFTVAASQCPPNQHLANGQCVPDVVSTGTKDSNGMVYPQPFMTQGIKLNYFNEASNFDPNFRSDGMRFDFEGKRDSVLVTGYFYIPASFSDDEISAKLNGGPHNDQNPTWADVFDLGVTNFDGTTSRIRWEATHPQYSSSISPSYEELPIGDVRGKWVGALGMKVNLDMDKNGSWDHVGVVGMIDVGGIDSSGKPVNNWKTTFLRIFLPNEIGLKSIYTPYVCTINQCSSAENVIRIDNSPPTGLLYKFVNVKEINAVPAA